MKSLVVALGIALLFGAAEVHADTFSPGPLNKGHAALDGLDNCAKCHPTGGRLSAALCLDCHTELKDRVAHGLGFHGRMEKSEQHCEKCHHEHQGEDFEIIDWGKEGKNKFDHAKTGWPLKGKHVTTTCKDCHEQRLIVAPEIKKMLAEHKGRATLLGAAANCAGCHFDDHRGQEGNDCKRCHDEKAWKPATAFDHNKASMASYPLEGAHAKVACDQCHQTETDSSHNGAFPKPVTEVFARYKPVVHSSCESCHVDPHDGRFGSSCEDCHSVNSWKELHAAKHTASKDLAFHEKTRYPLRGKHETVSCAACHGAGHGARFRGVPFALCTDCHADAHQGQMAKASEMIPNCERCHSVNGFLPPKFELEEHSKTRYPLMGAHQATPCLSCHLHDAARAAVAAPAEMRMQTSRRALAPKLSPAVILVRGDVQRCETCHNDIHGGQFDASRGGGACTRCHVVESFNTVRFDHATARFPLEGKHAPAACVACHKAPSANAPVAWRGVPTACASCHADAHAGQFGANSDCATCHDASAWKPARRFIHAPPFTNWLLDGKHINVACKECHPEVNVGGGLRVARYKPVPHECESCHADQHDGSMSRFSR